MKWLKRFAGGTLVLYLVACVVLYFVQEKLIMHPTQLSTNHVFRAGEEVNIEVAEDIKLNALWFREKDAKGVVLFWHGNRGSNHWCTRQAQTMTGNQYDVLMPDYRGYGKSDGQIYSERQMYDDAQKVYDYVRRFYDEANIILVGYSLGSGIASYLAAQNNPQQLVLLAPFQSLTDIKSRKIPIIPSFIMKYDLSNETWLKSVKCPVTLFHGTSDNLIPYDSSKKLEAINPDLIHLVTLDGASHRGTIFQQLFRSTFRIIAQSSKTKTPIQN